MLMSDGRRLLLCDGNVQGRGRRRGGPRSGDLAEMVRAKQACSSGAGVLVSE